MKLLVFVLFLVCVIKATSAGCCYREPCVLKPCYACFDVPLYSGVVTCGCDCQPTSNALCTCGTPCACCFRDTSNPCGCCEKKCSPVCSCFAALEGEDCSCCKKSYVYFPEVEYPNTIIEMNPFFFTNCWNY